MARLPALVDLVSGFGCFQRIRVDQQARTLREAGMLSPSKRGTGASEVTSRDAACLLMAVLATDAAVWCPEAVGAYASLTTSRPRGKPRSDCDRAIFDALSRSKSPVDALESLVTEAARDGTDLRRVRILVMRGTARMEIRMEGEDGGDGFSFSWSPAHEEASRSRQPLASNVMGLNGYALTLVARLVLPPPAMDEEPGVSVPFAP